MTSVEIMSPRLGDAFIDLARQAGVGFNACFIHDVLVNGAYGSFHIERLRPMSSATVHFSGVDPSADYSVAWNGHKPQKIRGAILAREGSVVEQ